MSIVSNLLNAFEGYPFKLSEAYEACPTVNKESVRSRIYENLGTVFSKIGRGVYLASESDCIVIEGNGRDLSFLNDASIDCIITDHPWSDKKSNKGGNRNFAEYDVFEYTACILIFIWFIFVYFIFINQNCII